MNKFPVPSIKPQREPCFTGAAISCAHTDTREIKINVLVKSSFFICKKEFNV
jgi:hypothetical protein